MESCKEMDSQWVMRFDYHDGSVAYSKPSSDLDTALIQAANWNRQWGRREATCSVLSLRQVERYFADEALMEAVHADV